MDRVLLKNKKFLFILTSAFLAIFGLGLIIPVLPFIIQNYLPGNDTGKIAFTVGTLISTYAVCQFFAAPVLGALSDRFGRRPVLLLCLLGSAVGYVLFGIGGSLWILYAARVIDGLTGGDIATMFSYIADITKPEERGKYYGMVGATIGLGFMLGPTIGGLLSRFGLAAPVFFAAAVTFLNMLFGYFVLPESLDKNRRSPDFSLKHLNPFAQLQFILTKPMLTVIISVGMFYFLPFAFMTGVTSVYLKDILAWPPQHIGFIFLALGIGDMITQGYLSGKLEQKFGNGRLLVYGFILTGAAYTLFSVLPLVPYSAISYIYILAYALGSGLFEPSFNALISQNALPQEQGRAHGGAQSMEAITRIIGPLISTYVYRFYPGMPYLLAAVLSFMGVRYFLSKNHKIRLTGIENSAS